jgi:hypothetical protein
MIWLWLVLSLAIFAVWSLIWVALRQWKSLKLEQLRNTHDEQMKTLRIWTLALTHNAENVAAIEFEGEPGVFQLPDEDDDGDNVVYIDEDNDEAKYLMGVLNYDDAG